MKVACLENPGSPDGITLEEWPDPQPGPGQVLIRVRACSLNFHDVAVVLGMVPVAPKRVLLSDGAGEVEGVGPGVSAWKVGDRVASTFFPNWPNGSPDLPQLLGVPGDHADGFSAERVVVSETALTRIPEQYDFAEAATLPCAALTAWRALMAEACIKPGDVVLVQGSGGVSIFALQFAKAAGAVVVATSSSDEKLERLGALGADHLINYKTTPDWGAAAKTMTNGRGVDCVVEIGGPQTLAQSIAACRIGGHISMIGVLTGISGDVPTAAFFSSNLTMSGITVGSHRQQVEMIGAIEANDVRPVIDRRFKLEEISDAFAHQIAQRHFGKIVLDL